jgi:MYXO-CTERM domain-containing protein
MMPLRPIFAALCALVAAPVLADTNLVANPGFETGDFTSWTVEGENRPDHTFVSSPTHYPDWDEFLPHNGSSFAALGGVGSDVNLYQDIATTPGETYTFSFHLGSDGEKPNEIHVYWNVPTGFGIGLFGALDQAETPGHDLIHGPAANAYDIHSYTVTADHSVTRIAFLARNDDGWWALDDVSVTLPEPSSPASLGAGILALAACARHRRRR